WKLQPKSSDFVYKNRDCLTLVVRQPHDPEMIRSRYGVDPEIIRRSSGDGISSMNMISGKILGILSFRFFYLNQ
ncbi:MAG: hypothetical protein K2L60_10230, partial [Bacteroides sp.]|nr:hypothetical protein [Bacteroides sp.]